MIWDNTLAIHYYALERTTGPKVGSKWPGLWLAGTLWEEYGMVVEDTAMEPNYLSLNSRLLQPLDTTLTSSRLLFLHI